MNSDKSWKKLFLEEKRKNKALWKENCEIRARFKEREEENLAKYRQKVNTIVKRYDDARNEYEEKIEGLKKDKEKSLQDFRTLFSKTNEKMRKDRDEYEEIIGRQRNEIRESRLKRQEECYNEEEKKVEKPAQIFKPKKNIFRNYDGSKFHGVENYLAKSPISNFNYDDDDNEILKKRLEKCSKEGNIREYNRAMKGVVNLTETVVQNCVEAAGSIEMRNHILQGYAEVGGNIDRVQNKTDEMLRSFQKPFKKIEQM